MTCNAIATGAIALKFVTLIDKIKCTSSSIRLIYSARKLQGCASSKNHPINSQCLWCFIPIDERKMVIMGNKMNFYLFSNSKRLFFDISNRCNNQIPSICKIFKIFLIFFQTLHPQNKMLQRIFPQSSF
jgi:hypothetical protein